MFLDIMKEVHDKAPVRKKKDRQDGTEEGNNMFHGPKIEAHGAHDVAHRDAGGWQCKTCSKYTTTHLGWRRLVRAPCTIRAKASRANWKRSFHRKSWARMGARKLAA
eukprot:15228755-Heterocapsa_arctica.AAC.1